MYSATAPAEVASGDACVCNQMCINCTVVSQARPHKSVKTHLVPQAGRSSEMHDASSLEGEIVVNY